MKRFLIVILVFVLGACSPEISKLQHLTTASVSNPVTKDMLFDVENGAIIAFSALRAYKRSCVQGVVPPTCRVIIGRIQVYTRKLEKVLPTLRAFVKNNDQVNAQIAYNTVIQLIADFKSEAVASNVQVQ